MQAALSVPLGEGGFRAWRARWKREPIAYAPHAQPPEGRLRGQGNLSAMVVAQERGVKCGKTNISGMRQGIPAETY
jgi:hypothetical protein